MSSYLSNFSPCLDCLRRCVDLICSDQDISGLLRLHRTIEAPISTVVFSRNAASPTMQSTVRRDYVVLRRRWTSIQQPEAAKHNIVLHSNDRRQTQLGVRRDVWAKYIYGQRTCCVYDTPALHSACGARFSLRFQLYPGAVVLGQRWPYIYFGVSLIFGASDSFSRFLARGITQPSGAPVTFLGQGPSPLI